MGGLLGHAMDWRKAGTGVIRFDGAGRVYDLVDIFLGVVGKILTI